MACSGAAQLTPRGALVAASAGGGGHSRRKGIGATSQSECSVSGWTSPAATRTSSAAHPAQRLGPSVRDLPCESEPVTSSRAHQDLVSRWHSEVVGAETSWSSGELVARTMGTVSRRSLHLPRPALGAKGFTGLLVRWVSTGCGRIERKRSANMQETLDVKRKQQKQAQMVIEPAEEASNIDKSSKNLCMRGRRN